MKRLIGVCEHDFRKGMRRGKIHLAFGGVGKSFCGSLERRGIVKVESGNWYTKKWIHDHKSEICKSCLSMVYDDQRKPV